MANIDPTGYDVALANIQPGALSERQQRVASAMAMVRDGETIKHSASLARIPQSTLWGYLNGKSKLGTEAEHGRLEEVTEHSYDISRMAAEAIKESLSDRPADWRPGDLVKAYGVATDKIIAIRNAPASQTAPGISALAALLEGADVTITKRDPAKHAIDVTPEGED